MRVLGCLSKDGEEATLRDVVEAINFEQLALLVRCAVLAAVMMLVSQTVTTVPLFHGVSVADALTIFASLLIAYGGTNLGSFVFFTALEPLGRTPVWSLYFYASSFADGPLTFGILGILARSIISTQISAEDLGDATAYDMVQRLCVVIAVAGFLSGIRRLIVKSFTVRMAHRDYVERCVAAPVNRCPACCCPAQRP